MKLRVFAVSYFAVGIAVLPAIGYSQNFSRSGEVKVLAGNQDYQLENGNIYLVTEDSSGVNTSGQAVSHSTSLSYSGVDENGDEQTMDFTGLGQAQGDYGILRTRYAGTLNNSFYNPVNTPLYNSQTLTYDANGVPDLFNAQATAGFVDTLQFGGTATNYYAQYVFHISGSTLTYRDFSYLDVKIGANTNERFYFYGQTNGVTNKMVATKKYLIGSGGQKASVQMNSIFQPNLKQISSGASVSGDCDFYHTVVLSGIQVTDENGNVVSNIDINGMSGTHYQAVPEPATMAALGLGLAAVARRRKRN
ncbi:MAG: PEP-CTERM sorting domain-containing protein [Armatimonadetes bacterium]|nr:PEP-CTERM sorting domain-containing protein [Armatimonadota bacterium]